MGVYVLMMNNEDGDRYWLYLTTTLIWFESSRSIGGYSWTAYETEEIAIAHLQESAKKALDRKIEMESRLSE